MQSYLDQEIISESPIDSNTTLSIPIHCMHNSNQPLLNTSTPLLLYTRAKAFSKSANAKYKFFRFC